ncbi:MAG: indole-3-glycerol phosphate synthase TrpC [Bacteroidota bacterium]
MNILDKIVLHKQKELAALQQRLAAKELERSPLFELPRVSLKAQLTSDGASGIIAEFKRKSPSQGIINDTATVKDTVGAYQEAGVSGVSVLTDGTFFMGQKEDVEQARSILQIPILRKDFILDTFQILEARAMGADVILLIAAILTPEEIKQLALFAHSLQLEVLMEVHNQEELDRSLNEHIDLVGVNNRNLKDFTVDIHTSLSLSERIPNEFVKVAESGLSDPKEVLRLREVGFKGFLMGQRFMETQDPGQACREFVKRVQNESVVGSQ